MADVSLDDLITQDKQKNKTKKLPTKKPFKSNFVQKKPHQGNPNRPQKQFPQKKDNNNFKKKFIKKHDGPKHFQKNDTPKQGKFKQFKAKEEKPKAEKADQGDRIVKTLKVMGLSPEFTNEDLYKLFATEGALEKCLIEQDNFGRSLNTALVKYHSPEHAKSAILNINKHKIMNCVLTVEPYKRTIN